MKLRMRRSVR